ncbi:hypothetical protein D3C87_1841690 [compost metagenome]
MNFTIPFTSLFALGSAGTVSETAFGASVCASATFVSPVFSRVKITKAKIIATPTAPKIFERFGFFKRTTKNSRIAAPAAQMTSKMIQFHLFP